MLAAPSFAWRRWAAAAAPATVGAGKQGKQRSTLASTVSTAAPTGRRNSGGTVEARASAQ